MTGTIPVSSARMMLAALGAPSDGTQQPGSFVMTWLTRMEVPPWGHRQATAYGVPPRAFCNFDGRAWRLATWRIAAATATSLHHWTRLLAISIAGSVQGTTKPKDGGRHETASVHHSHGRGLRDLRGPGDRREADSAPCRADSINPTRWEAGFGRGKDGSGSDQEYQRLGEGDNLDERNTVRGPARGPGQAPAP